MNGPGTKLDMRHDRLHPHPTVLQQDKAGDATVNGRNARQKRLAAKPLQLQGQAGSTLADGRGPRGPANHPKPAHHHDDEG